MSGHNVDDPNTKRRRIEFDDALKGYYQDHDAVLPGENTDYKSLTAESVGSLILGCLSALTFISMLFVIFPILGIILGVTAIRKILRATEEHAGLGMASAGVGLSALLAVAAMTYHAYWTQYAVPLGYEVIQWSDLIADPRTGRIPERILKLSPHRDEQGNVHEGTPVFIQGYMDPTRRQTEIRSFMLVPEIKRGGFGSVTPNPSQMVDVTLLGDLRVTYRTNPVRVGGILTVNPEPALGTTPYSLRADVFR